MMRSLILPRRHLYACVISCALLPTSLACGHAADGAEATVSTVTAERRSITKSFDFVGRLDAPERVAITARVKGFLEEVLFREGDTVHEGAPLYRIEKALFDAEVEQAQGALERANAELTLASI